MSPSIKTLANVAGGIATVAIYQFLHTKDPTFPSILTLLYYLIRYFSWALIAMGGLYTVVQYLGLVKYIIEEDIFGKETMYNPRITDIDPSVIANYKDEECDPEDEANYTSIG